MTELESALGRRSFALSQENRVLTVDDPTNARPREPLKELSVEEIAEFERARDSAKRNVSSITSTARERIEFLTGIGRIKANFTMDNICFHLQSLKSGELEEVLDTMIKMGETNEAKFNFELRRQTLARSLASVDSMSLSELIGSDDLEDKLMFIRSLDENLVDIMYKHYELNILKVSKERYAINTDKDIEEVVDGVKK